MSDEHKELSESAERGELSVKPGTVRRGADAQNCAQDAIIKRQEPRPLTKLCGLFLWERRHQLTKR